MKSLFTKRALMHIPHGLAFMLLFLLPPVAVGVAAAVLWAVFFLLYELDQDWHVKDGAWRDIIGFLEGVILGAPMYYYAYPWV